MNEVNVRLADGSVVLAKPYLGGWMGGTEERRYPDFEVIADGKPMANGIQPKEPTERISREQMFFEIAHVLRKRSTCKRGKVGCVIVRDRRIISQGYNGSPPGQPHCFELGCDVDENNHAAGCQRTIHAEANAIAFAARHGVSVDGCVLYSTHSPCLKCAQLISVAGLTALYYDIPYRITDGIELLAECGIQVYGRGEFTELHV